MAIAAALVTVEQHVALPDTGTRTELIRGRIVEVPPAQPFHCWLCARISRIIGVHVEARGLGEVFTNDRGVITRRDPDSLRGADVAFYRAEKLPPPQEWTGYFPFPPDLVVEVRSPSDRWKGLFEKVLGHLAAGVGVVVVLDPETRSAHVFEADGTPRVLGPGDTLAFPDLLGDFAAAVGSIFD